MTGAAGAFSVAGSHTYAEAGTFTSTVVVADDGGSRLSRTLTFTIADAALSAGTAVNIVGNEDQALVNVPVAIFTDPNPLSTTADIISYDQLGRRHAGDPRHRHQARRDGWRRPRSTRSAAPTSIHTSVGSPFTLTVTITDEDIAANTLTVNPTATISPGAIASPSCRSR